MKQIRPRLPVVGLLARSAVIPAVVLVTGNMAMVMFAPVVHLAVRDAGRHVGRIDVGHRRAPE